MANPGSEVHFIKEIPIKNPKATSGPLPDDFLAERSHDERELANSMEHDWQQLQKEYGSVAVILHNNTFSNYRATDSEGILYIPGDPYQIRSADDTGIICDITSDNGAIRLGFKQPECDSVDSRRSLCLKSTHQLCPPCLDILNQFCQCVEAKESENRVSNSCIHHFDFTSLLVSTDYHECHICKMLLLYTQSRYSGIFDCYESLSRFRMEACWQRTNPPELDQPISLFFCIVDINRPRSSVENYAPIFKMHLWPMDVFSHHFKLPSSLNAGSITAPTADLESHHSALRMLARWWLSRCISNEGGNHETCNKPIEDFLPTRLLDVKHARTGHLRLVLPEQDPAVLYADRRWCTLSHCWGPEGGTLNQVLTSENLASRCQVGLRVAELPQLFKDAVMVADWLDVNYLWIDCLCILQDSGEDWMTESGLMAKIYRNAWLNISGDAGNDSRTSLFTHLGQSETTWPEFEATEIQRSWTLTPMADYQVGQIQKAPTFSRAWIYHERQLSPRILHFTSKGLAWECCATGRPSYASESFPGGVPYEYFLHDENKYMISRFEKSLVPGEEETYATWEDICRTLSAKDLTKHSDRPIILSSIAKDFASLLPNDTYVAGHWVSALPFSLLWAVTKLRDLPDKQLRFFAPTWSWLQTPHRIKPSLRARVSKHAIVADVLDIGIQGGGGGVLPSRMQLRLRGFLRRIRVTILESDSGDTYELSVLDAAPAGGGGPDTEQWRLLGLPWDAQRGSMFKLWMDRVWLTDGDNELWALFVVLDQTDSKSRAMECLVLDRSEEWEPNVFMRIGKLELADDFALKTRYRMRPSHPEPLQGERDPWALPQKYIRACQDQIIREQREQKDSDERPGANQALRGVDALYQFDCAVDERFDWLIKLEPEEVFIE